MMRFILSVIVLVGSALQLGASPCVSPTFDIPFPGATDVTSHVTDLPSSAFPAFWQKGRVDGYAYKIFANATGVLRGGDPDMPWAIEIMCDASVETCALTQTGTPPQPATRVAERLGQCLVSPLPMSEAAEKPDQMTSQSNSPEPIAAATVEATTEERASPCGLAVVDELTDIATMQRLLVLLGEDPGPVDGFLGPKSFAAMNAFVSNAGWGTSIPELVNVLSERHCSQTH
ncbi:peptidoglycan-binding protein [Sulfitobacter sp. S190]|uniref:peptidoglycan-binding domain-containing protein n=1 Tax=Sulfitobacter sp. S190 TaxID=2867022 RepID=UPI0021A90C26|nr:hypothetical protein [Sulfitobacter sp. S190]UWR22014.1 hypothetical protein K3756_15220 [Sulfitobacter sp. S190]